MSAAWIDVTDLVEISAQARISPDGELVLNTLLFSMPANAPITKYWWGRHPHLHRTPQQKPEAIQMDEVRRPDFGVRQTLLSQSPTDFM